MRKLFSALAEESTETPKKAAVVPYINGPDGIEILVMKSSDPAFGGPDWQISKGHVDPGESPLNAAIREGEEELGLRKSNLVQSSLVMKVLEFTGLKESYFMACVRVEVKSNEDFGTPHYETGETKWMTVDQFLKIGRKSQRHAVSELFAK